MYIWSIFLGYTVYINSFVVVCDFHIHHELWCLERNGTILTDVILQWECLSTSPPKNHAVLYIRAIYRISQISKKFALSASFRCLKPENTIKNFNMTCVAMRSRVLGNSHFLAKFAMLHICQTDKQRILKESKCCSISTYTIIGYCFQFT